MVDFLTILLVQFLLGFSGIASEIPPDIYSEILLEAPLKIFQDVTSCILKKFLLGLFHKALPRSSGVSLGLSSGAHPGFFFACPSTKYRC